MSKITNDDLTQSGTECFSCIHMAAVGVKWLSNGLMLCSVAGAVYS